MMTTSRATAAALLCAIIIAAFGAANAWEVEPASARLKIIGAGWVMANPWKTAKQIEPLDVGKVLIVTGSTRDYLQVRLKDGTVGYVEPTAIDLVKPTDQVFMVTSDSPIYERPNRFAKKVGEIVRRKPVKVTGIALNYLRVKLRSGVVGFVPISALQ
jgi:D-arabinose 1-dehydrogenase-like Zn-dependent alcohol dehydrogenase